ncbi:tRNA (adenosine(37)-N6)-threonylcarbamoyltransferase complex ATPase subunit type 1 TsaE [Candidatus Uhrbacteria bacterium]|nr:tRNA (adenosine(37)-N6)-threonylcarbamoyltransferase complex ATPase subunit type 1 TsaE [Candidatus Uhrbacteria bacterium]
MRHIVHSLKETQKIASEIALAAHGGDVFALQGELGAGKTVFVKAFAKALGVRGVVSSPTFLLMKTYNVKGQVSGVKCLVHVDAYRVHDAQELVDIGLGEYLGRPDTVVLIEWAEKVKKMFPQKHVQWIRFQFSKRKDERVLTLMSNPIH